MVISSGSSPHARGLPRPPDPRRDQPGIIPARAGFTRPGAGRRARRPDHPRTRGVYDRRQRVRHHGSGSSPHARGLQDGAGATVLGGRIIPARAGFTFDLSPLLHANRDHPRTRGVYPLGQVLFFWRQGIIPARAGFTHPAASRAGSPRDHPRTRGVYLVRLLGGLADQGSSPHARGLPGPGGRGSGAGGIIPARAGFTDPVGTNPVRPAGSSPHARGLLGHEFTALCRRGIIPARAGFTPKRSSRHCSSGDHPRTRGVYIGMPPRRGQQSGSSPHARGLQEAPGVPKPGRRIIPARAGFTPAPEGAKTGGRDHPRTRGVYRPHSASAASLSGSSPHARGLPQHAAHPLHGSRIIPARAGFTGDAPVLGRDVKDHPRTRGVYVPLVQSHRVVDGSSPHARGLRDGAVKDVPVEGIIPARAGFTRPP